MFWIGLLTGYLMASVATLLVMSFFTGASDDKFTAEEWRHKCGSFW